MSQFIGGIDLEGPLPFHMTPYQLIKPTFKHFPKNTTIDSLFSQNNQTKVIDQICQRYSQIQKENFKANQEFLINKKCSSMKKKIGSSFNPRADGRTTIDFFKDEMTLVQEVSSFPMNLKHMANGMPHKILLQKKYHPQINIKMVAIEQAKQIQKQKEDYNNWLISTNDRSNSPNFNKMTYLLQKLKYHTKMGMSSSNIDKSIVEVSPWKHKTMRNTINELNSSNRMSNSIILKQTNRQYWKRKHKYMNRISQTKSPSK